MKILVTGSAGFIGTHVEMALRERGDRVTGLDKKTGWDLSQRTPYPAEGYDVIVHLASTCSTPGSMANPKGTFYDTVVTTANVLEMARISGGIPVIVTSSVKARDGMTPYGAAKQMVETWAFSYHDDFGLPVVINRPGTVYGPGQEGSEESGWIAWFCEAKRLGREVTINGDGSQIRDLLHVSDYVDLLIEQIDHIKTYQGCRFDVGGGEENAVSVLEVAQHLGLRYRLGPARHGDAQEYIGENSLESWKPKVRWRESETLRG